ncbi:MAG: Rid family hydrolase [Candidatus Hinthialibacter antarcticus]|nr:Rid family hydrolase [Candidatus Hinthialibacter antarcticus]
MLYATDSTRDLVFITVTLEASADDPVFNAFHQLANYLNSRNAVLLQERIFASTSEFARIQAQRAKAFEGLGDAVAVEPTYIDGADCEGAPLAGIHALATCPKSDKDAPLVMHEGRAIGRFVHGREAEYCLLSDVSAWTGQDEQNPCRETTQAIQFANDCLQRHQWSYKDVRRTWFYLDNILDWYDDFNAARNILYSELGVLNGKANSMIPASTGIMGSNAKGHRCTLDLLAARPQGAKCFYVERLVNNKQNEATDYGSAFSRGMAVNTEVGRYMFISGTASIDEDGRTVHLDDSEAQIRRTMLNVKVLLESVNADLSHICRATVFMKYAKDLPLFRSIAAEFGFPDIPLVCTVADVCRDDLLFEIDASAILNWV